MAINPSTGSGWKDSYTLTDKEDQQFEGIEKNGYFLEDIIISKENHKFHPIYNRQGKIVELYAAISNQSIGIQTYYLNHQIGMTHILKPESAVITEQFDSSLNLHLNKNMTYYILINDPKISISTANHGIVPRLFRILKKRADAEHTFIIIKVKHQLIFHNNR